MAPTPTLNAAAVAAALLLAACGNDTDAGRDPSLIHQVQRGDLAVTVRERAELAASADVRITSQLEGRATLIFLIPEGSVVAAGDRVAELDSSDTAEKRANQAILVAEAQAAWDQARKNVEIVERELEAAENEARNRLAIAEIRLEKFLGQRRGNSAAPRLPATDQSATPPPLAAGVAAPPTPGGPSAAVDPTPQDADAPAADRVGGGARDAVGTAAPDDPDRGTNAEMLAKLQELLDNVAEADPAALVRYGDLAHRARDLLGDEQNLDLEMGEMANQILQRIDEVNLARADLEMAADTLFHSRRLESKSFITRNELERDVISHKRNLSQLTLAWNNLQLLIKYTLRETRITLQQEIDNSRLALASVRASAEARRVREAAELSRSESWYRLAKERLDNYDRQLVNAVIRAPSPGLVVYGRYDWDEPVYEGMEVREGQDIVILPDIETMIAELEVHEAQIDKVAVGQRADVKVDAFPGKVLPGRVRRVSSLPNPTRRSTDPKVYEVVVEIVQDNSDGRLRPGMNATVEVDVGVFRDVLNVPVPSVKRHDDAHYVWRLGAGGAEPVRVELGRSNLTHVEVLGGIAAGDRVLLVPPSEPPAPAEQRPPVAAEDGQPGQR